MSYDWTLETCPACGADAEYDCATKRIYCEACRGKKKPKGNMSKEWTAAACGVCGCNAEYNCKTDQIYCPACNEDKKRKKKVPKYIMCWVDWKDVSAIVEKDGVAWACFRNGGELSLNMSVEDALDARLVSTGVFSSTKR